MANSNDNKLYGNINRIFAVIPPKQWLTEDQTGIESDTSLAGQSRAETSNLPNMALTPAQNLCYDELR